MPRASFFAVLFFLLFHSVIGGAEESLTLPFKLNPQFEKYLSLLAEPGFLVAILENENVKFRDIERFEMKGKGELKIIRSVPEPLKYIDIHFLGRTPQGLRYRVGALWNLKLFEKLSGASVEIITKDIKEGKVAVVVDLTGVPNVVRNLISSSVNSQNIKPINPEIQGILLAYLNQLGSAAQGPFELTLYQREKILLDHYNTISRNVTQASSSGGGGGAGQIYLVLTLFIWLILVPSGFLVIWGWCRFRKCQKGSGVK